MVTAVEVDVTVTFVRFALSQSRTCAGVCTHVDRVERRRRDPVRDRGVVELPGAVAHEARRVVAPWTAGVVREARRGLALVAEPGVVVAAAAPLARRLAPPAVVGVALRAIAL